MTGIGGQAGGRGEGGSHAGKAVGDGSISREPVGAGAAAAVLLAPAKLTVSLAVIGTRADGYHLLDAEMVTLDFADTLVLADGDGLEVSLEHLRYRGDDTVAAGSAPASAGSAPATAGSAPSTPGVPGGDDNLVRRALAAVDRRAHVVLVKRIPPGAGLGGGSADAAAVLRWAGCRDVEVAARLGADVPFCVVGGRARVTGIGDVVEPLPYVERDFVLVLPPFGVDTASVYRAADDLASARGGRWDRKHGGPTRGAGAWVGNDLEEAALVVEPRLAVWRDALAAATGAEPRLAGSGSTWFVEGSATDLGVAGLDALTVGSETGRLVATRTLPPADDGGPPG
ncbi:MAG: 4-(cytidine 5'-diphospho)-2-C-methyl-D-erythritol kinase [Acidimicrobiales bacterium]